MINLNAYDVFEPNTKYWISIHTKTLYLRDIKPRKYYCFFYRYDSLNNDYDYFILLTDDENNIKDAKLHVLTKSNSGVIKIHLFSIFDKIPIDKSKNYYRVDLTLEETSDVEELYRINYNPNK